jgi:hypothetical protein
MKHRARLVANVKTDILLIEEKDDGFNLYEFREDGFVGDTWHRTVEHAKAQATYRFGTSISAWKEVPLEFADPVAFGRMLFKAPRDQS